MKKILTIATQPSAIRDQAFKANGMELKAQESSNGDFQNRGYDRYDLYHWKSMGWESRDWRYAKKNIIIKKQQHR